MSFNPSVIPPESRNPKHIAEHVELYKRTMDTFRVHNPTDEDCIVWNDRLVTGERWVIPSSKRDVGVGKGNLDVPRYIMMRYLETMGTKMIQEKSKKEWDKLKVKYRREEWGQYEERLAIRTNDPKEWDLITPKLVLRMVSRYQEEMFDAVEPEKPKEPTYSPAEASLQRLDMIDNEIGIQDAPTDDAVEDFINQTT